MQVRSAGHLCAQQSAEFSFFCKRVADLTTPAAYFWRDHGLVSAQVAVDAARLFARTPAVVRLPHSCHHPMLDRPIALAAAPRTLLGSGNSKPTQRSWNCCNQMPVPVDSLAAGPEIAIPIVVALNAPQTRCLQPILKFTWPARSICVRTDVDHHVGRLAMSLHM